MSPRVTEQHKEQRRLEILQAAAAVFKRKGYDQTSMQDVIDETGMSRGGVYLYFTGKEELFWALLEQVHAEHKTGYDALLEKYPSAWEAVEHFLRVQQEEFLHVKESLVPAMFEFFSSCWRDEKRRPFMATRYKTSVREFAAFLQAGVERGDFHPILPVETIAQFVISLLDGISADVLLIGDEVFDVTRQIDSLRVYLHHALQVKEGHTP